MFHWIAPSGFETHQLRERGEEEANRQHTKLKMSENNFSEKRLKRKKKKRCRMRANLK